MNLIYNFFFNKLEVFLKNAIKKMTINSFKPTAQVRSVKNILLYTYIFFFNGLLNHHKKITETNFLKYLHYILTDEISKKSAIKIFKKGQNAKQQLLMKYLQKFKKILPHNKYHNLLFEQLYEQNKYSLDFQKHLKFKTIIKVLAISCPIYEDIYNQKFLGITQAYKTLNCPLNATQSQIKNAYRTSSLRFHPDRCSEEISKKKFLDIQSAYHIISKTFL